MYRQDIKSYLAASPLNWGISFHDDDNEDLATTINIKALIDDWYSSNDNCPDNETGVYDVSFFNDATGQVFLMDSREDKLNFEDWMKFLMDATGLTNGATEDTDYHRATAAQDLDKSYEDVTSAERLAAKTSNFPAAYKAPSVEGLLASPIPTTRPCPVCKSPAKVSFSKGDFTLSGKDTIRLVGYGTCPACGDVFRAVQEGTWVSKAASTDEIW